MESAFQIKIKVLTYLLAGIAVTGCIVRNDYNVVFSFLLLAIINKYFKDGPQYYSKILFQMMAGLIIVDIIWLVITLPYWGSESETHNDYWESLSFVHGLAIFLAFVQIGVKALTGYIIFENYKKEYKQSGELFTFHYDVSPVKQ